MARVTALLRIAAVGGFLLVVAAIVGFGLANSPARSGYLALRDLTLGYEPWHVHLTLGQWASDGLLAIFFFLIGLELKREFRTGDLRSVRTAVVPVVAAVGGVVTPALIYAACTLGRSGAHGWAIPTATDIAFAVAVLAVVGSRLPAALRLFLLTLAVVDDLLAIVIIAIAYTPQVHWLPLLAAALPLALFAFVTHRYTSLFVRHHVAAWLLLLPLGTVTWALVHASGIHATIAGVLLGFAVPVGRATSTAATDLAQEFEHRFRPLSAGFAVPVFAFCAAGVPLSGGASGVFTDPIVLGIALGLLLGKPVGILAATWLVTTFTRSSLHPSVRWADLAAVSLLASIGFTVSLLIAEITFADADTSLAHAKVAILGATTVAAVVAAVVLALRNRSYR